MAKSGNGVESKVGVAPQAPKKKVDPKEAQAKEILKAGPENAIWREANNEFRALEDAAGTGALDKKAEMLRLIKEKL